MVGPKKIVFKFSLTLAALMALAAVWNAQIATEISAAHYIDSIQVEGDKLGVAYDRLTSTTDSSIFNDLNAPLKVKVQDSEKIEREIQRSRSAIDRFEVATLEPDSAKPMVRVGPSKQSTVLEERAHVLVEQSRSAITQYEGYMKYMLEFSRSLEKVWQRVDEFNQVSDINVFADRGYELRLISGEIFEVSREIESMKVPSSERARHDEAAKIVRDIAMGFSNLAYGIDIAVDANIYMAAHEIESATIRLYEIDSEKYADGDTPRALKDIESLNEKLDLIEN